MAGGFLDKLFHTPVPGPEVVEALADLGRLGRERPSLAEPVALLTKLLPALAAADPTLTLPTRSSEQVAGRLAAGLPLLRGEDVSFGRGALGRSWKAVCAIVRPKDDALRRGPLAWVEEMAAAVLSGRAEEVHARAGALSLDAGLVATILRFTLFPYLVCLNTALTPLRSGIPWGRGYCPTCGSWPLLGEYRGLEQDHWLRCGLCAAGWEFPRLACPFCDNRDHHRLGYLHVEGEEARRRAATCEECRGYVKAVATLGPLSSPGLLVADLATVHLDLAAAERGYAVPA